MRPYITFLLVGTALRGRKRIVLVPFFILLPTPLASLPNSFTNDVTHMVRFGPVIRYLNSSEAPLFGSITEFASCEFIIEYFFMRYCRN